MLSNFSCKLVLPTPPPHHKQSLSNFASSLNFSQRTISDPLLHCLQSLPKDLANHLSREGNSDKASIVQRNGKVWLVDLLVEQEKMFMGGEGWQDLVQANSIELGYLLILRYRGNFVFSFRVFDPSSCEHACSSSASAQKTKGKMIAGSSSSSKLFIPANFFFHCCIFFFLIFQPFLLLLGRPRSINDLYNKLGKRTLFLIFFFIF